MKRHFWFFAILPLLILACGLFTSAQPATQPMMAPVTQPAQLLLTALPDSGQGIYVNEKLKPCGLPESVGDGQVRDFYDLNDKYFMSGIIIYFNPDTQTVGILDADGKENYISSVKCLNQALALPTATPLMISEPTQENFLFEGLDLPTPEVTFTPPSVHEKSPEELTDGLYCADIPWSSKTYSFTNPQDDHYIQIWHDCGSIDPFECLENSTGFEKTSLQEITVTVLGSAANVRGNPFLVMVTYYVDPDHPETSEIIMLDAVTCRKPENTGPSR